MRIFKVVTAQDVSICQSKFNLDNFNCLVVIFAKFFVLQCHLKISTPCEIH